MAGQHGSGQEGVGHEGAGFEQETEDQEPGVHIRQQMELLAGAGELGQDEVFDHEQDEEAHEDAAEPAAGRRSWASSCHGAGCTVIAPSARN